MIAPGQYPLVELFIVIVLVCKGALNLSWSDNVVVTFESADKSDPKLWLAGIQAKSTEQYSPVLLFIMLYKV